MKPWSIVTIHKSVRELDAKIYLAYELIEKGFDVVLGRSTSIISSCEKLPKGIYCDSSFKILRLQHLNFFRSLGSKVVTFDEEATAFLIPNDLQVSEEVVSICEQCYIWGEHHLKAVKENLDKKLFHHLKLTGHPRLDMCRDLGRFLHKENIKKYQKLYGKYILINSNVGSWDAKNEEIDKMWKSRVARGINEKYSDFLKKKNNKLRQHKALVSLIKAIAKKYPQTNVIVRPHFNETDEQWKKKLKGTTSNIKIIHEGSSIPWIMGAKVVIHTNCTTGIEAFITETPCISYEQNDKNQKKLEISEALSVLANDQDEVFKLLDKWQNDPSSYKKEYHKKRINIFKSFFEFREDKTSAQIVSELMSKISFKDKSNDDIEKKLLLSRKKINIFFFNIVINFLKIFPKLKIFIHLIRHYIFNFKKMPPEQRITRQIIKDRILNFKKYKYKSNIDDIDIVDLGNEIFIIKKIKL